MWLLTREPLTGIVFAGFGLAFLLVAQGYPLGTVEVMGPGFVPTAVSSLLICIGATVFGKAAWQARGRRAGELIDWELKPLIGVVVCLAGFALAVQTAGFVISSLFVLIAAGSLARERKWREIVLASIIVTLVSTVLFVVLLGVYVPLFPWSD